MTTALFVAIYWFFAFVGVVIAHRYAGGKKVITGDELGIYFITAPLAPIVGVIGFVVWSLIFLFGAAGIDLTMFEAKKGTRAKALIRILSGYVSWLPNLLGVEVVTKEEVRKMREEEWKLRDKADDVKGAEVKLRIYARNLFQMGTELAEQEDERDPDSDFVKYMIEERNLNTTVH